MMSLIDRRRAIRHLLDERNPADGLETYLAFYYDDRRAILRPYPLDASRPVGYVCLSRTGADLFRPFVTLRLPIHDPELSADVIYDSIDVGTAVLLQCPDSYSPLISALFQVQTEETLQLFQLKPDYYQPHINVLVTQDVSPTNNLPRFIIRNRQSGEIVASASLNWQTDTFGEIAVYTHPDYRRRGWGRSVVSTMVNWLLENGRTPLYAASQSNIPSRQLAERVGFTYTGTQKILIQGVLQPRP
ncbi:MAG TPA: GNAT family N-acetyltransferase [Chloroflexi bacterium]|nr:GNAT family N-acetyltransferase [Chloroflexota bacterium]